MSAREIDDYLANLEEPKRTTLVATIWSKEFLRVGYREPRPNFVSLARAPLKPPDANPSENDRIENARQQGPPGVSAPCRRLHGAR